MTASTEIASSAINPQATHVVREWKHSAMLLSCRFDPSGRFVFGTSGDRSIQRWLVAGGDPTRFSGHMSWLRALGFSLDGTTTYSAGYDGKLMFWETASEDPEPQRIVDAHQGWVRSLAVDPSGRSIATGGNDRLVKIWSVVDGKLIRELKGHESHIYSLAYHPSGQLLSGDLFGNVLHWNAETGERIRTIDAKDLHTFHGSHGNFGGVHSLALSTDGKYLTGTGLYEATNPNGGAQSPLAVQFQWDSGAKVRLHTAKKIGQCINYRGRYHTNGDLLCGLGKQLAFWRAEEAEPYHVIEFPSHVLDFDLHPDQLHVATAHFDGHLRLSKMQAA